MRIFAKDTWAKLAIVLAIVCLFAGMFKLLFEMKYQAVVAAKRSDLQIAANNLDLQLNCRLVALQMLSTDPEIISMQPASIARELERAVKVMGFFNAVVFDTNGNFIAEGIPSRHIGQVYDQPSFARAVQGNPVISGRIIYSDLNSAYVSLRVPIENAEGDVIGVLVAGLPINTIGQFVEQKSKDEEYIFALDHNARFIKHPNLADIYPESEAYLKYKDLFFKSSNGEIFDVAVFDGVEKLYIYTTVEKAEWRIVSAIPRNLLYFSVLRAMLPDMLLMLLLLVIIGLGYRIVHQTQKYKAERENMRVDRLATVSLIAAGLAHEIRNPLTAIKGFVQLMARKSDQPAQPAHLHIMLTEIERIERLTNEFRMLARPPRPPQYKPLDLVSIIQDVILLIDRQAVEKGIKIQFQAETAGQNQLFWPILVDAEHSPEGSFIVRGDEGQMKQVLLNLLRNAIEAIEIGGNIRVTISKKEHHVIVAVKDTGSGISQEILDQIGTPFFTTKESGTGLGLSLCLSIIQQHGGKIEINSVSNVGTMISVFLPEASG
ncbi:sporulation kinase C [Sporomusaceae bacterium FL31]|nr:sporulation kinase C [Sporomusaceae bacterium FL31]GCE35980.1 sporulation kinase C [Sporomusaceae bacterium]